MPRKKATAPSPRKPPVARKPRPVRTPEPVKTPEVKSAPAPMPEKPKPLPVVECVQVLEILEKGVLFYHCRFADGTTRHVPVTAFTS